MVYLVDSGMAKLSIYNPETRTSSLVLTTISKASANQRAGRVGRVSPGKCFRLYTEYSYNNDLKPITYPSILCNPFTDTLLKMKKFGIEDIVNFDFIDPPSPDTLMRAYEELYFLGILDYKGVLTKFGENVFKFPVSAQQAKCILFSKNYNCTNEIISIIAMMSIKKWYMSEEPITNFFKYETSDHLRLWNVYKQYSNQDKASKSKWCNIHHINYSEMKIAEGIYDQLKEIIGNVINTEPASDEKILKALLSGYFMNVVKPISGGKYTHETIKEKQGVTYYKNKNDWLMYDSFTIINGNPIIGTVSVIDKKWLLEVEPKLYYRNEKIQ